MAYSPNLVTAHRELVVEHMVAELFKQIVPARSRLWIQAGLNIKMRKDAPNMNTILSISYIPTERIEPTQPISINMTLDKEQMYAISTGQYDMINTNAIVDFFTKLMMVYEIEKDQFFRTESK